MLFEVVRDAADGIHRIPQIDVTVAVEIHRILLIRRRHKLTVTHRAGERSLQIQRIVLFVARHKQKGFQLAAEVAGTARIVKRQRGERVENARFPHDAAPARLYADNADDDLRRHAVDLLGAR